MVLSKDYLRISTKLNCSLNYFFYKHLPNIATSACNAKCSMRLLACFPALIVTSSLCTSTKSNPSDAKNSWHPGAFHNRVETGIWMLASPATYFWLASRTKVVRASPTSRCSEIFARAVRVGTARPVWGKEIKCLFIFASKYAVDRKFLYCWQLFNVIVKKIKFGLQ